MCFCFCFDDCDYKKRTYYILGSIAVFTLGFFISTIVFSFKYSKYDFDEEGGSKNYGRKINLFI